MKFRRCGWWRELHGAHCQATISISPLPALLIPRSPGAVVRGIELLEGKERGGGLPGRLPLIFRFCSAARRRTFILVIPISYAKLSGIMRYLSLKNAGLSIDSFTGGIIPRFENRLALASLSYHLNYITLRSLVMGV
jgi:hypothetical protein